MPSNNFIIPSKIKSFRVIFVKDLNFLKELRDIPTAVVICGKNVFRLYRKSVFDQFPRDRLIVMPLEEKNKNLDSVRFIYDKLLKYPFKKNLTVVSFGGGVNQDVVGFTVSTLYRGVNWIYVPTTLLAQADSAIGLKTSLNYRNFKNVLGTFYPPDKIYIHTGFLDTLPKRDYFSGLGEVTKLLLMEKNSYKNLENITEIIKSLTGKKDHKLQEKIIKECIRIKLEFMAGDEFDRGKRNLLNYGHELGHALESVSDYQIPHGSAVVIGMMFANLVAFRRGWMKSGLFDSLNSNIFLPQLSYGMILKNNFFSLSPLISAMKKDKKRTGNDLTLVLPKDNLDLIKITDYNTAEFKKNLKEFTLLLNKLISC